MQKCKTPWSLDALSFVWSYEKVVRKAILSLKYKYAEKISEDLLVHLEKEMQKSPLLFPKRAVLVPIPLFKKRTNWRGFNQSEILGKHVAGQFGWQFRPELLERIKETDPQTGLKAKQRRKNVRGAFRAKIRENLGTIILFDDVYTTGSTIKEAAKVLKRRGAGKVWGFSIAC